MGLDSVEILMKVEETFGIKIPDQEAEQIYTVGDFHNSVWRHLSGRHSEKCKSQHLFYMLRESFANMFNFSPQRLTLDTSPEDIFPKTNRRELYLSFSKTTDLKLSDLVLAKPWAVVLTAFGFLTIIGSLAASVTLIYMFNFSNWALLAPVAGIILTFLLSLLLNPKRTVIEEATIREFTQHTLALNYSSLVADEGANRREMESVINYIISDMAGVDLEEVTSEKKIAYDLGID